MTVVQQLMDRAADYLEEYGWCQKENGGRPDHPQACLWGAMAAASGGAFTGNEIVLEFLEVARQRAGCHTLTAWNDEPGRTKEQVIAMLRGQDWRAA